MYIRVKDSSWNSLNSDSVQFLSVLQVLKSKLVNAIYMLKGERRTGSFKSNMMLFVNYVICKIHPYLSLVEECGGIEEKSHGCC